MFNNQQKQSQHTSGSTSIPQLFDPSIIQFRLDTSPVLARIRTFLTGKVTSVAYDENKNPVIQEKEITAAKANDKGIQWIISYCENILNPSVVSGNFEDTGFYERYIAEVHDALLTNLMNNLFDWEIDIEDYSPIIDTIMAVIQPFMSRLIKNLERESYNTIKINDSNTYQKGRFSPIWSKEH